MLIDSNTHERCYIVNKYFKSIFSKAPYEILDNDYYYNSDQDGDCFDETDRKLWLDDGCFKKRWMEVHHNELFRAFYRDVCIAFSKKQSPFLEIACGPGMGLTPIILSEFPNVSCLATDASSLLIKSWRTFINNNLNKHDIHLASFSTFNIPIKSNSLDVITSFIGLSSTRKGEQGKIIAANEVYRILKDEGYFIAIENEWVDYNPIYEVFEKWGQPVWTDMKRGKSWYEIFSECGFIIESCDKTYNRKLSKDDNELGEQAYKFGIEIELKFTLFILRKCNQ